MTRCMCTIVHMLTHAHKHAHTGSAIAWGGAGNIAVTIMGKIPPATQGT